MPKYQKTVTPQNVLQPSRQKYSKTFGRNHLWLSSGPSRPSRARRRLGARDRTRRQKFPRSPARHFAPGRGASQEARRPLAGSLSAGSPPPSSSPSLPPPASFGCMAAARTEPLNSHRSPPPPAQRWSEPLPPPAPRDARTSSLLATAPPLLRGRRGCTATLSEPRDLPTRLGSRGAEADP